jgi:DNA-binding SARP family transcriptional activator
MMTQRIDELLAESERLNDYGDTHNALRLAAEALDLANDSQSSPVYLRALLQKARTLASIGRFGDACEIAQRVRSADDQNVLTAEALLVLGICAAESGQLDVAEGYFQEAVSLSRAANHLETLGRALDQLAFSVYTARGQYNLAISTMEESNAFLQDKGIQHWGLPFLRAYIANITGDSQRMRHALDELLPLVRPATRIAGAYYFLWACLCLQEGELEKAEEYIRLTFRIAGTTGAPDLNCWIRIQYSRYYRLIGKPADARFSAEDGVHYADRFGFRYLLGQALVELGYACWELGENEPAEEYLRRAIPIFEDMKAGYDLARANFILAAFYQATENPKSGAVWSDTAGYIVRGGYSFILEQERTIAFPLLVAHIRSTDAKARFAAEDLLEHLAHVPPQPLNIAGLGGFSVWQGRRKIPDAVWSRRKSGELFRYLLLRNKHAASREEVLEDLWPDHSLSTSQGLFHQATSTLRHILEPNLPDKFPSRYLSFDGDRIMINLPPGSMVDFEQFEQRLPEVIESGGVESLQKALNLYIGDLFPIDRYADWSAGRRDHLEELYLRGELALGQAYYSQEQYYPALNCARTVIQRDNWNEDAVLLGMRAYYRLGDVPRALRLYKNLEKTLAEDLQLQPRSDLRTMADKLRQDRNQA